MSNEPTSLMSDDMMPEDFETCAYGNKFEIHSQSILFIFMIFIASYGFLNSFNCSDFA